MNLLPQHFHTRVRTFKPSIDYRTEKRFDRFPLQLLGVCTSSDIHFNRNI